MIRPLILTPLLTLLVCACGHASTSHQHNATQVAQQTRPAATQQGATPGQSRPQPQRLRARLSRPPQRRKPRATAPKTVHRRIEATLASSISPRFLRTPYFPVGSGSPAPTTTC